MKKIIYNYCPFYKSSSFSIIEIQTNNILILANYDFATKQEIATS